MRVNLLLEEDYGDNINTKNETPPPTLFLQTFIPRPLSTKDCFSIKSDTYYWHYLGEWFIAWLDSFKSHSSFENFAEVLPSNAPYD